jgi:D-ribose pyranase
VKRTALLHAELSHVIASLGHGDMLVLGDAGLPIPDGPRRIDLAVARGVPQLTDVADEALDGAKQLPGWYPRSLGIAPQTVSHEEFKRRSAKARAVVRTGECTPYANIMLVAGVHF